MLDNLLVSRNKLAYYKKDSEKRYNELLHDESIAFAADTAFPEY
jgi:hypothetical protein